MSAVKVYFPREDAVKVHQTRVKPCPDGLLAGYYWYGSKRDVSFTGVLYEHPFSHLILVQVKLAIVLYFFWEQQNCFGEQSVLL